MKATPKLKEQKRMYRRKKNILYRLLQDSLKVQRFFKVKTGKPIFPATG